MAQAASKFKHVVATVLFLSLFAIGYGFSNQYNLVHGILYRLAVNDFYTASIAIASLAFQAIFLAVSCVLVSRRMFWIMLCFIGLSITVNAIFGQILNNTVDYSQFNWLISESRQAGHAAGQFIRPVLIAIVKVVVSLSLFTAFRSYMRRIPIIASTLQTLSPVRANFMGLFLFLLPSAAFVFGVPGPRGAERNVYEYAGQLLMAPPPPQRGPVLIKPDALHSIRSIVWIIDESINYTVYAKVIKPMLAKFSPVDFGMAASLGNCSASANMALRSGVNINTVNDKTDLRTTPSIWAYARKAGYRTVLLDGQVEGSPQNLLLAPEFRLIDDYRSAKSGIRTDLHLADTINTMLRRNQRQFIYVVLRGVHFQYSDHYPKGSISDDASLEQKYAHAVQYSKTGFFDTLFRSIDRNKAAIIYTSDHGQNVKEGVLPHCAPSPSVEEFKIPMIAFVPEQNQQLLRAKAVTRSASQIFPTTLEWMGYDKEEVAREFDNTLESAPKEFIWFGKAVVPSVNGGTVDLHVGKGFPARPT
jgi:hypothetical protein